MDHNLAQMVRVTEAAALSSARMMGRGDRKSGGSSGGGCDASRVLTRWTFGNGRHRRGERDEAPMLFIGGSASAAAGIIPISMQIMRLRVWTLPSIRWKERTCVRRDSRTRSRSFAVADDGQFLVRPIPIYAQIVVGPWAHGRRYCQVSTWNLSAVAEAKRCAIVRLTVVILGTSSYRADRGSAQNRRADSLDQRRRRGQPLPRRSR